MSKLYVGKGEHVIDLIWFTKTMHIHVELKKKLFLTNFINFQNIHYVCLFDGV